MFGLNEHILNPKIKLKNKLLGISRSSIFLIDAVNSFLTKRISNTFQIRGDKIQRQQNSLKTK